jgi:hypothetical protein
MVLDEQSGELTSGFMANGRRAHPKTTRTYGGSRAQSAARRPTYGDVGGASRFYYVAKPSREERDMGCYDLPARSGGEATDRKDGSAGLNPARRRRAHRRGAEHPSHGEAGRVDALAGEARHARSTASCSIRSLGSGTTGMACRYEQRQFIGIEREAEYVADRGASDRGRRPVVRGGARQRPAAMATPITELASGADPPHPPTRR